MSVVKNLAVAGLLLCCAQFTPAAEQRVKPSDDVNEVLKTLKAGDVLVVEPGVYTNHWQVPDLKGTAEKPIVIRGRKRPSPGHSSRPLPEGEVKRSREQPRVSPAVVIRPTNGRDGIVFWPGKARHIVLENLRVEKAKRGGIVVFGSSNITIRNCEVVSNGVWGIQTCMSDVVTVSNCVARGSVKEHGIYFSTTDHPVVVDSLIYNNNGCGIHLNAGLEEGGSGMITGGVFRRNLIFENGRGGGAGINMDGVEQSVVAENTLFCNYAGGIVNFCQDGKTVGSGNRIEGNTIYVEPGQGRYGVRLKGGRENVCVSNTLVCGEGPALDVRRGTVTDVKSDHNAFYSHDGGRIVRRGLWWYGLEGWQKGFGRDVSSGMMRRNDVERLRSIIVGRIGALRGR